MKRFLLFLLLGPAVGFAVFELREIASGRIIGGFPGFIMGLPFAYWFGLIPSLVMWLEDWFLEDKMQLWPKVLTSALDWLCREYRDDVDLDVGVDPAASDPHIRDRRRAYRAWSVRGCRASSRRVVRCSTRRVASPKKGRHGCRPFLRLGRYEASLSLSGICRKKEQGRSPARKIVSTLLPQTLDFILA